MIQRQNSDLDVVLSSDEPLNNLGSFVLEVILHLVNEELLGEIFPCRHDLKIQLAEALGSIVSVSNCEVH